MSGFEDYDFEGTLTIASFAMCRLAWYVAGNDTGDGGLLQLITGGERRGEDRIIPHVAGRVGYPRRLDATRYDLSLWTTGDVDQNGADVADSQAQLAINLALIRSTLFEAASPAADGTLAASVTIPGWGTKAANIHMLGMVQQRYNMWTDQSIAHHTLQISIPAGRFA